MLFNSYFFIFLFLPIALSGFFLLGRYGRTSLAIAWLVLASLFFYGWWNPAYLGLLLVSIVWNFWIGQQVSPSAKEGILSKATVLTIGVTANLGLLAYYKYANFFLENVNKLWGSDGSLGEIILPLGISFFTFTQIAYLADAYRGKAKEYNLVHYALFVTFFPHLIAGPILHHKEMMPQFSSLSIFKFNHTDFAAGITLFVLGLAKKVLIADSAAGLATPVFTAASAGQPMSFTDAWGGALSYTFQLYFDFSGYSDMAIGLALMFGICMPLNFDSPYKATSIVEFWRRWHMTLSRFLRDYLYIPLGGSRQGKMRRYSNLVLTMFLGGLWHGAGWTFIAWGTLHGVYLVANHGWTALRRRIFREEDRSAIEKGLAWLLTFIAVVVGWVFFRASDFTSALSILRGMFFPGSLFPSAFYVEAISSSPMSKWGQLMPVTFSPLIVLLVSVGVLLAIVLCAPNSQQIIGSYYRSPLENEGKRKSRPGPPIWLPTSGWALLVGIAAALSVLRLSSVTEFLYFQF